MSERKWNVQLANAYIFSAFAGATDGMQEEEYGAIAKAVVKWHPKLSNEEVIETCKTSFNWFLEDMKDDPKTVVSQMLLLLEVNKGIFEKIENTDKFKKSFMEDLVNIAMADGNFHENEKSWINLISEKLDVKFSI